MAVRHPDHGTVNCVCTICAIGPDDRLAAGYWAAWVAVHWTAAEVALACCEAEAML